MDKGKLVNFFKTFIDKKLRIDGKDTILYINENITKINQRIIYIKTTSINTNLNSEEINILIDVLDIISRTINNNTETKIKICFC